MNRLFTFVAGVQGPWEVQSIRPVTGASLPEASRLAVIGGDTAGLSVGSAWSLRGITSNDRYVARSEKSQLLARQEGLGRPSATVGVLIPIRKSAAWWALTQDERLDVFTRQSKHTEIGLDYLPAIARRLHHCRDIAENEPFDFLTWFEFAPEHADAFEHLLERLRASEEWSYVDREVDIRLLRS